MRPGRRPSRRTFLIRRLFVLGVVVAVVAGLVAISKSVFTDSPSKAASQTEPTVAGAVEPATSIISGETIPVDPASTLTTTAASIVATAPADTNRMPTAADPARVLLVGDSEAGGLSPFLERALGSTGVTTMTTDYKSSTGLVRPDFYDWPAHLRETVPAANPDIVIALFGGNDGQSFPNTSNPVDSPEWRTEYGKRVSDVMDFLTADGRTLIWVGVPNAEKADLTARLAVQNEVVKDQIAKHPKVIFVDSWYHFIGIDGKSFAPLVLDPRDGQYKPVRSETDGFHLNTDGEEILAVYVAEAVTADLRERGAAV
jgi:uncharacterized protein